MKLTWNLRPFHMWGTALSVERFGNSANVYTTDDAGALHRVGLFTWGMDKREAQCYAS